MEMLKFQTTKSGMKLLLEIEMKCSILTHIQVGATQVLARTYMSQVQVLTSAAAPDLHFVYGDCSVNKENVN
jgi:hypothetical protein